MIKVSQFWVKNWSDGCVVFDTQSGYTHALDVDSGAVFLAFQEGVRDMDMLASKLKLQCFDDEHLAAPPPIEVLLKNLQYVGLVDISAN